MILEQYMYPEAYSMFFIIGFPANCLSLYVAWVLMKKGNNLAVYLINLSVGDLLYILTLPIWIMMWPYGKTICVICVFMLYTNFYTSAMFLSCIAVDRYLAIVYPLKFCTFRKRKTAVNMSIAAWIFTVIFNAVTVYPDSIYDEEDLICLDLFPLPKEQRIVNITRFVVGFLIPALVVGFCYWRIYSAVKKNQKLESMERRHVFRLLGSILLTLYLCFGPVHIMMVLRIFLENCPYPNWLFIGYKVCVLLAMLNCLADPLLYCFMSRMGQASASNVLLILRRRGKKDLIFLNIITIKNDLFYLYIVYIT
uniref:G protein-coupled receptor 65 n=1 Tax=Cyprinus carpio carpio TaxID=630221 RepID=A0A8C1CFN2_CYPCA